MLLRGLLLGSLALSAGALLAEETPADEVEPPTRKIEGSAACVRLDRIQDFQVIDSRTLIIWRPNRKDPHKISLYQGCPRLRGTDAIFFDTGGWGQLCGRGGEYLIITRPGIPSPRQRGFPTPGPRTPFPVEDERVEERCAVSAVERINDDVVHELLVSSGDAVPRGPERQDQIEVLPAESEQE